MNIIESAFAFIIMLAFVLASAAVLMGLPVVLVVVVTGALP